MPSNDYSAQWNRVGLKIIESLMVLLWNDKNYRQKNYFYSYFGIVEFFIPSTRANVKKSVYPTVDSNQKRRRKTHETTCQTTFPVQVPIAGRPRNGSD